MQHNVPSTPELLEGCTSNAAKTSQTTRHSGAPSDPNNDTRPGHPGVRRAGAGISYPSNFCMIWQDPVPPIRNIIITTQISKIISQINLGLDTMNSVCYDVLGHGDVVSQSDVRAPLGAPRVVLL